MPTKAEICQGCLLGLAVGDAMGYTVDSKSWPEIQRDYGPNGLLGYDLVNGYADVTSYTQLAAYTANALLLGATRGQLNGRMAPFIRYVAAAQREWAQIQNTRRAPDRALCWVSRVPELRRRCCMDTWMLDTLRRGEAGSPEEPVGKSASCGSLTAAIPVGLFFDSDRMKPQEIGQLGMETVALTHGDPATFLSGAVLAYCVAGLAQEPEVPMEEHFLQAADAAAAQFGRQYPQAEELRGMLHRVIALAKSAEEPHQVMTRLECDTAPRALAGAFYAVLTSGGDFDAAMICAVNHSGRSAAVGAVAGALLGASLGEPALPEFYMDCLEPAPALRTLADDLAAGCPLERSSRLFDDDWDRKYIQGEPVDPDGWSEA